MESDHRLSHMMVVEDMAWPRVSVRSIGSCQASWRAVEALDQPRCSHRAEAMRRALDLVEAGVSDASITLHRLIQWHSKAVPGSGLRTQGWAFAKGGEEKYSLDNTTLDERLVALTSASPLERSLRAYLDILFFHPFLDGNSRVARLAFHHFACLDGLEFTALDSLFRLSIPAGNRKAYGLFSKLAQSCLVERLRDP